MQPQYIPSESDLQRLWSKIDKRGPDECWEWLAYRTPGGQGKVWWGRDKQYVTRVVWEVVYGPVPDGTLLWHICGNSGCCNPAHLVLRNDAELFWAKVDKSDEPDGCWLWTGNHRRHGYGTLIRDGRTVLAHRLVWEMLHGPIPSGMEICHKCDTPACVRPDHLFLGTHSENMRDCVQKGRNNPLRGERSLRCKLSDADVADIRRRWAERSASQRALAREYGIAKNYVWEIVHGHYRS